jgi:hypothetical protein
MTKPTVTDEMVEAAIKADRQAHMEDCVHSDCLHAAITAAIEASGLVERIAELEAALNTPEVNSFTDGVILEAQHQRKRWGAAHDAGKGPLDWFWLIGYLAQKAADAHMSGNQDKALHHCISTAAALANWHAAISGTNQNMRPGIGPGNAVFEALNKEPTP